jgi:hypothetical protein
MKKALLGCASLLALAIPAVAVPAFPSKEEFHWKGSLKPGQTIEVRGFRGHIDAVQTDGEALVDAVKSGTDPLSWVKIDVDERSSGVVITAQYPRGKDEDDVKIRVDYKVKVPKGVKLIGRTEIGDVTVERLDAPVEAYTAIGDLRLETSSYAQGRTVNGQINAVMGQTNWSGTLRFVAVNGDITIKLPAHADTELSADSKAGRFETDLFPVNDIGGRYGARPLPGADVSGTLGRGGRSLKVQTINGDIRLLRRDS